MAHKLKLFPNVLIRLSGGSMDALASLNAVKTDKVLENIYSVRENIDRLKNAVNDEIYSFISQQSDNNVQKALLNLKRDVFNEREAAPQSYEVVKGSLNESINNHVKEYLKSKEEYNNLKKKGEEVFTQEQVEIHGRLKNVFQNEMLKKGLLLSSQSLLDRIDSYVEVDLGDRKKKEMQTEQGLIKYITRMHAKTSPFSTFTNLSLGEVSNTGGEELLPKSDMTGSKIISHIRLNNFLFQYLKTLLLKNKNISQWLLLRPNPTIQNKGDHFLFLTNNNNVEAFQRIPFNPVVELFRELTAEHLQGIVYRELIDLIVKEEYIDASVEELEAYISQLIEYGFFEFNIGVSGIDTEWDISLIKSISPIADKDPLIQELIDSLTNMRGMAKTYSEADLLVRKRILQDAFKVFRDVCMKLHEAAGLPAEERRPPEEIMAEQVKKMQEEKKKAEEKAAEAKKNKDKKEEEKPEEKKEEKEPEAEKKDEVFKHTSSTSFYFKPEQLFYEDTSVEKKFAVNHDRLSEFVKLVDEMIGGTAIFEGYFDERQRMKHFFGIKYQKDGAVDLLTFYEDFFRDFKKEEATFYDTKNKENQKIAEEYRELEKKAEGNKEEQERLRKEFAEKTKYEVPDKFKAAAVDKRSENIKKWYEELEKISTVGESNPDLITIKKDWLKDVNSLVDQSLTDTDKKGSYGMFVQLFEEADASGKNKLRGVLNATFPGYGKLVSRFLHIFDPSFTNNIREWNISLQDDNTLYIEDCDASYFNANLHPPLMPGEVWMPNGHNSLPADRQIPVTDLAVKYIEDKHNLILVQKSTGKEIYVFDLGFQGHGGRSQLFQLLDKFSKAKILSWHPLLNAGVKKEIPKEIPKETLKEEATDRPADANTAKPEVNLPVGKAGKEKKEVRTRPRIMLENDIVLQRKAWFIPRDILPLKQNMESDWAYYERLNVWRAKHKIPNEVFVFIYSQNQRYETPEQAKNAKRLSRDDYKPQYICFNSPFLVDLFEKLLTKVPISLRIEEMLPNSSQLFKFGENKHIAEFVVQWYNYNQ